MTTEKEFEDYLVSIGGLVNGNYFSREPIVANFCECGTGWLGLIKALIEDLITLGWNKEIRQAKEKFGGLRFYAGGLTQEMHDCIVKYELLSTKTCEVCGTTKMLKQEVIDG